MTKSVTNRIKKPKINESMEGDFVRIVNFMQKHKMTSIKASFKRGKGWSVSQKYCCKEHTPKDILRTDLK